MPAQALPHWFRIRATLFGVGAARSAGGDQIAWSHMTDRSMTAIACMRKAISPNRVGLTALRERYAIHETRNSTPRIAHTIEMLQRQKVPESAITYCR
jgi:hypothetical protein